MMGMKIPSSGPIKLNPIIQFTSNLVCVGGKVNIREGEQIFVNVWCHYLKKTATPESLFPPW